MNFLTALVAGAGIGGLAMYELDPEMGRRRRAVARDKMIKLQRKAEDAAGVTARDLRNRTLGSLAEGRARLMERHVPDDDLRERIRSEFGFLVRYPSFLDVDVREGVVVLSGHALSDEGEQLIRGVRSMRGVRDVENRVEAHQGTEDFPGLHGQQLKPKPTGRRFDIMQQHWSPATRLFVSVAALAGLGALAYSFSERNGRSRRRRQQGIIGRGQEIIDQGEEIISRGREIIGKHKRHGIIGRVREELRL